MLYHYLNTARTQMNKYLSGNKVKPKKYFYALRPILACRWIEKYHSVPPILFDDLVKELLPDEMKEHVLRLLDTKVKEPEGMEIDPIMPIQYYIIKNIKELNAYVQSVREEKKEWEALNQFFLEELGLFMGKWTCRCGQAMNDHRAPDPNAYSVYSDELFEEIINKADDHNKISYDDISEASFYMWKCPECGSFMVFGEDGEGDRFTFYERQEAEMVELKPEPLFDPAQELNLVVVEFQEGGNGYTYICEDPNIHIGHAVVVPVGKENTEKTALVVQKYHALPKDITFPVEKLKRVIRRYSHFDPHTSKIVCRNLIKLGRILDACSKNAKPANQQYYSIKTPLGYFWLELNGVPIPMKITQIQVRDKKYQVDGALYIKPSEINCRRFYELELCADFDIDASRWIDVLSDENVWGNSWELNGLQFGITAGESPKFEDEVVARKYSRIPLYYDWHPEFEDYYGFSLAWKKYKSDSDLSIDFYTT